MHDSCCYCDPDARQQPNCEYRARRTAERCGCRLRLPGSNALDFQRKREPDAYPYADAFTRTANRYHLGSL